MRVTQLFWYLLIPKNWKLRIKAMYSFVHEMSDTQEISWKKEKDA